MKNDKYLEEIDRKIEEEKHNYKGPHCCMTMHYELLSDESVLQYNARFREYGIKIHHSNNYIITKYCTDCGTKLPESLRNKWFQTLKQLYNLEDPEKKDKKKIPKPFLTDEWWNNTENTYTDKINKVTTTKNNTIYCCEEMEYDLFNKKGLLTYNKKWREYAIKIHNSSTYALMDYCPFCGTQFPNSLRHEWHDILEGEYKLEHPAEKDRKKVPKEFWTDEWWKKRNL